MKINTNFRSEQLHTMRTFVSVMYALAIGMVLGGAALLVDYSSVNSSAESLRKRALELTAERDAYLNAFQAFGGGDAAGKDVQADLVALFGELSGKSPESLLYDIEKYSPQSFYLTNFSYDRVSGTGTVTAIVSKSAKISTMLETLEKTGGYSKIMLVSKSDFEGAGRFKVVIRFEQEQGESENG